MKATLHKKGIRKNGVVKTVKQIPDEQIKRPRITNPMAKSLTHQEQKFVAEWLLDANATRAYQVAGFRFKNYKSSAVAASKLLRKDSIQKAIAIAKDRAARKTEISAEKILREYARLAFSDTRDLFREDGSLKAPHEWDDDTAAAVSGIEVEEKYGKKGGKKTVVAHLKKVRQWAKEAALEKLAKHIGLLKDSVEIHGHLNHAHIHAHMQVDWEKVPIEKRIMLLETLRGITQEPEEPQEIPVEKQNSETT